MFNEIDINLHLGKMLYIQFIFVVVLHSKLIFICWLYGEFYIKCYFIKFDFTIYF